MDNLIQELSAFMTPLPCFADERSRRAVLINAGLSDLLPSVNLSGSAYQCVASILHDFAQYGRTDALLRLLQEIRKLVGGDKQAECDALRDRIRHSERPTVAKLPRETLPSVGLFVDRRDALAAFGTFFANQQKRYFLLSGVGGIGKTALLAIAVAEFAPDGSPSRVF